MTSDNDTACRKCFGEGHYCWTCGDIEDCCECTDDDRNIGECDECDGTGICTDG